MENKRKVLKWIFLGLAILSNSFVLAYSAIPSNVTENWTKSFTTSFAKIFNKATAKPIEEIKMESLSISLSTRESYVYNNIPGYYTNEIPLGSAKQIESSFLPEITTNPSIEYYTDDSDLVELSQSGNKLSVVGIKQGIVTIHAKNKASGLESNCTVNVVDTIEPYSFELSVSNNVVPLNGQKTVGIVIDGGVLGTNELINFRYYDTRKLTYTSSNTNILTIDNNGVIHPIALGTATITVSNHFGLSKSLPITVEGSTTIPSYSNLRIVGSDICYGNDMLNDQNTGKNHTILEIFDGEEKLNSNDFIWESSNELLLKVDKYGVARGFRKNTFEDESVIVTAKHKVTGQSTNFVMTVKEQLPSEMYFSINNGKRVDWNPTEYTACVGDILEISVGYNPRINKKQVNINVLDSELLEATVQNTTIVLSFKKIGQCELIITSIANPSLSSKINFEILEAGSIRTEDFSDVEHSLRKIIGHASLFAIAQIFTIVTFILFFVYKEIWKNGVYSILVGLLVSTLSELIQLMTPGRTFALLDILINFSGVVSGAVIVILIILIYQIFKFKSQKK